MSVQIVKVQVPLSGPGPLLIYDRHKRHMQTMPLTPTLSRKLRRDVRVFFYATWTGTGWDIGERVEDQDW